MLTYIEATQKTQLENKQKKNRAEPCNNLTKYKRSRRKNLVIDKILLSQKLSKVAP